MSAILDRLVSGDCLSCEEAEVTFTRIMQGSVSDIHLAALLTALSARRPTVDELTGAARVMRAHVIPVPVKAELREKLVDTCGTGGAPKTFNISTASALIAAGAGAKVAKHGNRSRSGRGSAEVLELLGVNIHASPGVQARCLEEIGVCFSFAVDHHPAMKHAREVRLALGFPTIFNLLGPMTNPAGAHCQLLGVYAPDLTELLAGALSRLGTARAWVVHGQDGLDELTTSGHSVVSVVDRQCGVPCMTVDAAKLGLIRGNLQSMIAADLPDAARQITDILAGAEGPCTDIALLNAAATLVVAGVSESLAEALDLARQSIRTGAADHALKGLVQISQEGHTGLA